MAEDRMALLEMLRKAIADGDVDFLREGVRVLAQAVMEAEVSELTGLPKGERDPERRLTHRNGYRERRWDTRVGTIDLAIPQGPRRLVLPSPCSSRGGGPSGPCSRSSRRRTCWASARAGSTTSSGPWGIEGISRSEVSRICAALDAEVAAFRGPLARGRGVPVPLARRHVPQGPRGRAGSCRWRRSSRSGSRRSGERRILGLELAAGNDEGSAWPRVHPLARRARPARGPPRHQRRPRGSREGRPRAAPGLGAGSAAASTSPATPRTSCPARRGAWSPRRSGPCSSSPTRARPATQCSTGHRQPRAALPGGRRAAHRRRARPARPLHVPRDPPPPDPQHQPARAAQQGDQAPDRGRRDLPQPGERHPPRRDGPRRAGRRVAGRPALLPARDDGAIDAVVEREEVSPAAAHGELNDQARGRRAVTPRAGT